MKAYTRFGPLVAREVGEEQLDFDEVDHHCEEEDQDDQQDQNEQDDQDGYYGVDYQNHVHRRHNYHHHHIMTMTNQDRRRVYLVG